MVTFIVQIIRVLLGVGGVSARRTSGSYYEPYESHDFGGYYGPTINPNTVGGMYDYCTVSGVERMNIVTYRSGSRWRLYDL